MTFPVRCRPGNGPAAPPGRVRKYASQAARALWKRIPAAWRALRSTAVNIGVVIGVAVLIGVLMILLGRVP